MGQIFVVAGFAGSGKTELAKIIAQKTRWAVVDKDTASHNFVEKLLRVTESYVGDRESAFYLNEIRPIEYQILDNIITENMEYGSSLIVTAPYISTFETPEYWQTLRRKAKKHHTTLTVIWVMSDIETMRERINQRNSKRDTYKLTHWDEYVQNIRLDLGVEHSDYIVENQYGAPPLSTQAQEILDRIHGQNLTSTAPRAPRP